MANDNISKYPEWRAALDLFEDSGFTYGDQLPKAWLWEAFSLPEVADNMSWLRKRDLDLQFVDRLTQFRKHLEETRMMWLAANGGQVYEIVPVREQVDRAMGEHTRQMSKLFRTTAHHLAHTNTNLLGAEERREHADAIARLARLRGLQREVRRGLPSKRTDER